VDPELTIEADYEAMKQVVFNLLLNALEATRPGVRSPVRSHRAAFEAGHHVEDRGPGPAGKRGRLLAPLFTTKKNGTGLGWP